MEYKLGDRIKFNNNCFWRECEGIIIEKQKPLSEEDRFYLSKSEDKSLLEYMEKSRYLVAIDPNISFCQYNGLTRKFDKLDVIFNPIVKDYVGFWKHSLLEENINVDSRPILENEYDLLKNKIYEGLQINETIS